MASNDFVKLPENLSDFQNVFPGLTFEEILKDPQNPEELSPEQNVIRKYSGGALLAGRPLNSTMIFVYGIGGAGISTMIKILFDIPAYSNGSFCPIRLIQKQLKVSADKPPLMGNLNFVDVSGPSCDDGCLKEACTLASIRKFVTKCQILAARKGLAAKIRQITYPNIVLFAVSATDKRLGGADCFFRKSLQILKKTIEIIDVKRPNFIVVLTNAMSYPPKKEKFIEKLAETTEEIRQTVFEVVGIKDVDVVPIENRGEAYDMEKVGNFYKLPDLQLSHGNLFQAMLRRFDKNEDLLGRSLVGRYDNPSCPERKEPVEIVAPSLQISQEDIASAEFILSNIQNFYPGEPKEVTWLPRENGESAPYAVIGGHDHDNNNIYVIRANHEGVTIPGKLDFRQSQAYIGFGGVEHKKDSYEVLTVPRNSTQWEPYQESKIHPDAIVGGWDGQGGKYYIGRVFHNGMVTCGMVHPTDGCCYISSDGLEYSYDFYDVLIKTDLEDD